MRTNNSKEQIGDVLIGLAQKYPGFPVSLIWDGSAFQVGIIGLELEPDDWFFLPGPINDVLLSFLPESTALYVKSKKPQTAAAGGSDPGGTRTLNQLIKSQLLSPTPAKDK